MTSLARQLDSYFQALLDRVDRRTAATIERAELARDALEIPERAVRAGDTAPDFSLPDQRGQLHSLAAGVASGPVVLVFFRGGWCPFCSLTLRALDRLVPQLKAAGASLLAISPQTQAASLSTAERNSLRFPLLSDADNAVARRYGLVWRLDADLQALYQRLGHDLPRVNATPTWELPVAAGYVVAPDGRVTLAHVDPRVNRRMEPADALAAVRELQSQPGHPTQADGVREAEHAIR
jgi:peroxiredoxin